MNIKYNVRITMKLRRSYRGAKGSSTACKLSPYAYSMKQIIFGSKSLKTREIILPWQQVKLVSHQPCGSRAPICDDKFFGFVLQPHGVVNNTTRLPYEKQGRKAAATNFRHVHFLCDLFAFSERRTTAPRHTRLSQDTQGVCTTDVIVLKPRICLTSAARLPQGNGALYRKAVTRMQRNARLQCRTRTMYRFVLRQSCNFCMTVLRQPFI